jgi:hypothetical protein
MGAQRMDRQMETRPTALAETVVRALVPPASREHVLGDLQERFTSTRQYVLDALAALPFIVGSRIRRTTHPIGFLFTVAFLWFAIFYGPSQKSWLTASIPSVAGALAFVFRDAYRTLQPRYVREAAFDAATFALAVALSQALVALLAPGLILSMPALTVGLPLGSVVLFLVRVQMPGGVVPARIPREMSVDELRARVRAYEASVRRGVYAELVAAFMVMAGFTAFALMVPTWPQKIGCALAALGGAFVAWFMERRARVVPIPSHLDFAHLAAAYRSDIERRARLLRGSLWWYILPILLGPAALAFGPMIARRTFSPGAAAAFAGMVGFCAVIRALHRLVARKSDELARQIAALKEKPC